MPKTDEYIPSKVITTEVEMMGKKKDTSFTLTLELMKPTIKQAKIYRAYQKDVAKISQNVYEKFSPRNAEAAKGIDSGDMSFYDSLSESEIELYMKEKEEIEAGIHESHFKNTSDLLRLFYRATKGEDLYKKLIAAKGFNGVWEGVDLEFIDLLEETVVYWFRKSPAIC